MRLNRFSPSFRLLPARLAMLGALSWLAHPPPTFAQPADPLGQRIGLEIAFPDKNVERAQVLILEGLYDTNAPYTQYIDGMGWRWKPTGQTRDRMFPKLLPGRVYTLFVQTDFSIRSWGTDRPVHLLLDVPIGYVALIDGEPIDRLTLVPPAHAMGGGWFVGRAWHTLKLVKSPHDLDLAAAAVVPQIGDAYLASIGLGVSSGLDPGRLWLSHDCLAENSPLLLPTSILQAFETQASTDIVRFTPDHPQTEDRFQIRQILLRNHTPSPAHEGRREQQQNMLVDVQRIDDTALRLNFYRSRKPYRKQDLTYPPGRQKPFATIDLKLEELPHAHGRRLRITRKVRREETFYEVSRTLCEGDIIWSLLEGNSNEKTPAARQELIASNEEGRHHQILSTFALDQSGGETLQSRTKWIFRELDWSQVLPPKNEMPAPQGMYGWPTLIPSSYGREYVIETQISDPDGAARTTRFHYYDDPMEPATFGKIQAIEYPDGRHFRYHYHTTTRTDDDYLRRGRLRQVEESTL